MRNNLKKLIRDEDGNFVMLTAIGMCALFGAVGLGVNVAQLYHTKTNLSQALDAAVTSTARDLTTGRIREADARQVVQDLLQANSTGGFATGGIFTLEELTINPTDKTVRATAASQVGVAFPLFGMEKYHRVAAASTAIYSDRKVEVAMMLDITGSMASEGTYKNGWWQSKLDNLKDAASDAVDDLLRRNTNPSDPRIRVALVPYSQGVNTGNRLGESVFYEGDAVTAALGALSGANPLTFDRPIGLDELNTSIMRPVKAALGVVQSLLGDNCATERKLVDEDGVARIDVSDENPYVATVNRDKRLRRATGICPNAEVVPLTADGNLLKSQIQNFTAAGTTAGHIGIQWTQYLLSPKWGNFLKDNGFNRAAPAAYTSNVKKIAVLMTDGEFNTAYVGVNRAGIADENVEPSNNYARALCDQMKGNNVEVFTIGFMLTDERAKQVLRDCASPDTAAVIHFFDASSGEELKRAFDSITANIEKVRLSG